MTITTQKYVRKPVYVDAVRITVANFDEIATWCQGEVDEEPAKGPGLFKKVIKVEVQHPKNPRQSRAYVGDWILSTDTGYKIYTNKAFKASFNLVSETTDSSQAKTDAQAAEDERARTAEEERQRKKPVFSQGGGGSVDLADDIEAEAQRPQMGVSSVVQELVEATPETIAQAVQENEAARRIEDAELKSIDVLAEDPEASNGVHPIIEQTYQGKQVLSVSDQERMTSEEVRTLVQSGQAVLVQEVPSTQ